MGGLGMAVERDYLVTLAACPTLEPHVLRRLVAGLGSAEAVWHADDDAWRAVVPIRSETVVRLRKWCRQTNVQALLHKIDSVKITCTVQQDDNYPVLLRDLADPPLVLFSRGKWPPPANTFAVVGTRRASGYGLEATRWIADTLARSGAVVVSGLALGIDGAAHTAVLNAAGHTIAVLGCGVDVCYPISHQRLYERILETGTIVSEYPPGTAAFKHRFPERNRIIAGLAHATIVVQAGEKSGALRTVDAALDAGREVYAVPGPVTSQHFRGSHRLLQEGARILIDPHDLLADYGITMLATTEAVPIRWRSLFDAIVDIGQPHALANYLNQPLAHVYAGLLELEISGYIFKNADGTYRRA